MGTKSFMRPLCSHCNRFGHVKASCPQLRRCNHCGSLAHLARDCPEKSNAEVRKTSQSQEKQKNTRKCLIRSASTVIRPQQHGPILRWLCQRRNVLFVERPAWHQNTNLA